MATCALPQPDVGTSRSVSLEHTGSRNQAPTGTLIRPEGKATPQGGVDTKRDKDSLESCKKGDQVFLINLKIHLKMKLG